MTRLTHQIPHDKKEMVLNTAEYLFAEYGLDGTSIRMIREKSGVNSGMIYNYFNSKHGLYVAIFKFRLKQILGEVREFTNLDLEPGRKLEAYLQAYISRIEFKSKLAPVAQQPTGYHYRAFKS